MTFHFRNKFIVGLTTLIFYVYILFMIYILFFIPTRMETYNNINLTPFSTICRYFKYYHLFSFTNWFLNIFGNIIIFIPFGIMLPIIRPYFQKLWRILVITLIVTMAIEVLQYYGRVGELDIDDVILNTIGSVIGYVTLCIVNKIAYLHHKKSSS